MVTPSVRLVSPLGVGGMGSVWLADHLTLKTHVVVKFIAEELARDAGALARFAREAAAASQVKSPHVVHMIDHGVTDGLPYIVMEHLDGHDLGAHIEAHGAMKPEAVAEIVTQVSRALARAHEAGIVHRDVKPSNIFLCDAGDGQLFVKLLDFGVAKLDGNNLLDSKTRTGSLVGSPHYMSPEQVVGKSIDRRSDLWSLGVVAFEALTGKKPFEADTIGGLALKIHHEAIPAPTSIAGELPPSVDAWFSKACARDPSERFQSAKELADALTVAVRGEGATVFSVPKPAAMAPPSSDLALAKTSLDEAPAGLDPRTHSALSVPVTTQRSRGVILGVAAVSMIAGAVVVTKWLSHTTSGAPAAPLVLSASAPAPPASVPSLALVPASEAAPIESVSARKVDPKAPLVVHSVTRPSSASASARGSGVPSASALPVPTYDPNDIK